MKELTIVHFNDAYKMGENQKEPKGGAARARTLINRLKDKNPIVTCAGDIFNPSMLSTITKGKHMAGVLDLLDCSVTCVGNHDFDFGMVQLGKLLKLTKTKFLMSNTTMKNGERVMGMGEYEIIECNGVKIGFLGLIEHDWFSVLGQVNAEDFVYEDFVTCADRLSPILREKHSVDLVVALTHMRWENDERLAQEAKDVDIVLGGHDHEYDKKIINGRIVIKNNSDFKTMIQIDLKIDNGKIVNAETQLLSLHSKDYELDEKVTEFIHKQDKIIEDKMGKVIAVCGAPFDTNSGFIRVKEAGIGNFYADVMREDTKSDISLFNSGTIRGDLSYSGDFTIGNLTTMFPFESVVHVIKITGSTILKALENAVSEYPKAEGRFLQVSGLKFEFDPEKEVGKRIVKVQASRHCHKKNNKEDGSFHDLEMDGEYKVATLDYLLAGKEGFGMLAGSHEIVNGVNGAILSTVVRNHFLKVKWANVFESTLNTSFEAAKHKPEIERRVDAVQDIIVHAVEKMRGITIRPKDYRYLCVFKAEVDTQNPRITNIREKKEEISAENSKK